MTAEKINNPNISNLPRIQRICPPKSSRQGWFLLRRNTACNPKFIKFEISKYLKQFIQLTEVT
jgi:hypothetical protein